MGATPAFTKIIFFKNMPSYMVFIAVLISFFNWKFLVPLGFFIILNFIFIIVYSFITLFTPKISDENNKIIENTKKDKEGE